MGDFLLVIIELFSLGAFVLSQSTLSTDRRTADRQTDRQNLDHNTVRMLRSRTVKITQTLCTTEDVLSSRVTHYWSSDSRFICYAELNDTGVPLQSWPWYGHRSDVYVQTIQIAYPKVPATCFFWPHNVYVGL